MKDLFVLAVCILFAMPFILAAYIATRKPAKKEVSWLEAEPKWNEAFGEIGWAIGRLDDSSDFDGEFIAIADVFAGQREISNDALRREMCNLADRLGIADLVDLHIPQSPYELFAVHQAQLQQQQYAAGMKWTGAALRQQTKMQAAQMRAMETLLGSPDQMANPGVRLALKDPPGMPSRGGYEETNCGGIS